MSYLQLFNRAYALCIKFNRLEMLNDLPMMNSYDLIGVIYFLQSWQSS